MKLFDCKIYYFENPTQVQYYYQDEWHLGIGHLDEIIDCSTGKVIKTVQVIKNSLEPIRNYDTWNELYF